jgi:chromate reductase, NAD(P)H dehydrogenase (quinone)
MPAQIRLIAFAGSTRMQSYNKRLVRLAARGAQAAGAEVTLVDLRDFPMPLFDEDLEKDKGMPEAGGRFKKLLIAHDGFLISAPEYNSSITGVLKNAIDWASRPVPGEPPLVAFQGKFAALMSASPGALGGLRGLVHLRAILGNIGVLLIPDQIAVSRAFEAFNDDGTLKDAKLQTAVEGLGRKLTELAAKIKG